MRAPASEPLPKAPQLPIMAQLAKCSLGSALTIFLLSGMLACATGPGKTPGELQADQETSRRVESALDADNLLATRNITVRADGGVVYLAGYVRNLTDISEAKRAAKQVPGVTKVVDALGLQREDD
jgi:osmotically-inducible protein OsmY